MDLWLGRSLYATLLEAFEEGQQVIIRSVATGLTIDRRGLLECLLLELKTRVQIDLRGVHGFVPEPQSDDRTVDTAVQERHRRAVAQHMRRDAFAV